MKKLAILHTTPVTIAALKPLAAELLPGWKVTNHMDDSLLPEINEAGDITPSVRARFTQLVLTALMTKPDVVLCACSSVGGLLEECREFTAIPLCRIDEPMAKKAVSLGRNILVAATLNSTLAPTMTLIKNVAAGQNVTLTPVLIDGAGKLLAEGKTDEYEALILTSLSAHASGQDVIVLAQASMAGAASKLDCGCPVLSSPELGIAGLVGKS